MDDHFTYTIFWLFWALHMCYMFNFIIFIVLQLLQNYEQLLFHVDSPSASGQGGDTVEHLRQPDFRRGGGGETQRPGRPVVAVGPRWTLLCWDLTSSATAASSAQQSRVSVSGCAGGHLPPDLDIDLLIPTVYLLYTYCISTVYLLYITV